VRKNGKIAQNLGKTALNWQNLHARCVVVVYKR